METTDDYEKRPHATAESHVRRLLGGDIKYSIGELADKAGVSKQRIEKFWRAMGFPAIKSDTEPIFTDYDVDVIKAHVAFIEEGLGDESTLNSLIRAQSYFADREVLWQYEALVEEAMRRFQIDDTSARYYVLDNIDRYEEFLVYQLKYAWRRHLSAFLQRAEVELEDRRTGSNGMPLMRALGFVDLVSFTDRSGKLSPMELAGLIRTFEFTCRDVISSHGARTVKMVGDATLYIADDVATGALVVSEIVRELKLIEGMPDVRASLVWGGVLSRFGDVFGPNVNLASRLSAVAPISGIILDEGTARVLERQTNGEFRLEPFDDQDLRGIGTVKTFTLHAND